MRPPQGAYLDSTTRRQPPKSEFRRPKPERRPNAEGRSLAWALRVSSFGLVSALGFRPLRSRVGGTVKIRPASSPAPGSSCPEARQVYLVVQGHELEIAHVPA